MAACSCSKPRPYPDDSSGVTVFFCLTCGKEIRTWHLTALVCKHWAVMQTCGLPQETVVAVLCAVLNRQLSRQLANLGFRPELVNKEFFLNALAAGEELQGTLPSPEGEDSPDFSRPWDPPGSLGSVVERLRGFYYWCEGKPVVSSLIMWAAYDRFVFDRALKGGSAKSEEEAIVRLFLSAL